MPGPRENRLRTDWEKVNKLVAESGGTLKLVRHAGEPPNLYVIEYHCPGLEKKKDGEIVARQLHQVEISLGSDYPLSTPMARMLTPIFNPHVWPQSAICLGSWSIAETLDTLILRIGALLQLDPKVLNPNSPANTEANQWVRANRAKIPLGAVSFKAASGPSARIVW